MIDYHHDVSYSNINWAVEEASFCQDGRGAASIQFNSIQIFKFRLLPRKELFYALLCTGEVWLNLSYADRMHHARALKETPFLFSFTAH